MSESLESRVRELERHQSADAKDIAWMRENLTLARSQHNWNIATIVSILTALVAVAVSFFRHW